MKKTNYIKTLVLFVISAGIGQSAWSQFSINGVSVKPLRSAIVNFTELADKEMVLPHPMTGYQLPPDDVEYEEPFSNITATANGNNPLTPQSPLVVSPSPVLTYEGAPDEAVGGGTSGTYNIPPDTHGAVGIDKVFVQLNNNYRLLNKSTGAELSLVSMISFWSSLGADGTGAFDPRIIYDPYNNRWLLAAASNGGSGASRILLGISLTSDPAGSYSIYALDPDASGATLWADFPMLGFNKNWVAISMNMFTVAGGTFSEGRMFVIDYPSLLTGSLSSTLISGIASASGGFCMHPATTYSPTETTLYFVSHLSSAGATYKLSTITGTPPGAPSLAIGSTLTRTGGGWVAPSGNIEPEFCASSCPGTLAKLDGSDAQMRNNVVFRNGFVWYAQTVGLPSGGLTHSGVQWTKLTATTGAFADGGRVEDPTATVSNGGLWYAFPSISVNKNNDVLIGFSKFESDGFAGAAYAFRLSTDAAGTMQDPVVYKDGLDYYDKDFGSGRQRWGDYSHTMVDPVDTISLWTIQEYAKLRAAPTVGGSDSKWGTWWAKMQPISCTTAVASGSWSVAGTWGCGHVPTATDNVTIVSGQTVTLDIDPLAATITVNAGGTLIVSTSRTLSCNLIVEGTIDITGGKLTLGANNLTFGRTSTLTGASSTSYFVTNSTGSVSHSISASGSFEFPISANTTSYTSLTIALAAGDPTERFSVRVATGVTPVSSDAAFCVNRTWTINEITAGGNSAILTFKWAAADEGVSFNHSIASKAYRNNGSIWVLASTMSVPALSGGIYSSSTLSSISTFSPWIVSSTSVLPIGLEYIRGYRMNNEHIINWKVNCTSMEAKFEIERSRDAIGFIAIGNIRAGYVRCLQPFDFTDVSPMAGINYYRIKMIDVDGKISYSPIIALLNKKSGFEIVGLVPTLVNEGKAILNMTSAQKQIIDISVTDAAGKLISSRKETIIAGSTQLEMDFNTLSAAVYTLTVRTGEGDKKTIRFVKQ